MTRKIRLIGVDLEKHQYRLLGLVLTLVGTTLEVVSLSGKIPWDETSYSTDCLINRSWTDETVLNVTTDIVYMDHNLIHTQIVWMSATARDVADGNRCRSMDKLGDIIADEKSNPWMMCRYFNDSLVVQEDSEMRSLLHLIENSSTVCGDESISSCLHYINDYRSDYDAYDNICCQHCCVHSGLFRQERLHAGMTLHEPIYTVIACVIVSMLLQTVSYFLLLISFIVSKVSTTRMGGVTSGLSGFYLMLACVITHYKVYLMNQEEYSDRRHLDHVHKHVYMCSYTEEGNGLVIAWAAVVVISCASTVWIQFSRYLVYCEMYVSRNSDEDRAEMDNNEK